MTGPTVAGLVLKACPFCGGNAEVLTYPEYVSSWDGRVRCTTRGCDLTATTLTPERWNTRAADLSQAIAVSDEESELIDNIRWHSINRNGAHIGATEMTMLATLLSRFIAADETKEVK